MARRGASSSVEVLCRDERTRHRHEGFVRRPYCADGWFAQAPAVDCSVRSSKADRLDQGSVLVTRVWLDQIASPLACLRGLKLPEPVSRARQPITGSHALGLAHRGLWCRSLRRIQTRRRHPWTRSQNPQFLSKLRPCSRSISAEFGGSSRFHVAAAGGPCGAHGYGSLGFPPWAH
jgi:hypothetical protein